MIRSARRIVRPVALVLALALLCGAASSALAGSLSVKVPRRINSGHVFKVVVKGRYSRQTSVSAFLVVAIQPTAGACQSTAQHENHVKSVNVFFHNYVTSSPFKLIQPFKAIGKGKRRVCAYLYSKLVNPSSRAAPIATASRRYRTR